MNETEEGGESKVEEAASRFREARKGRAVGIGKKGNGCRRGGPISFAEVIDVPCDAGRQREILDLLAKAHQASREHEAECEAT